MLPDKPFHKLPMVGTKSQEAPNFMHILRYQPCGNGICLLWICSQSFFWYQIPFGTIGISWVTVLIQLLLASQTQCRAAVRPAIHFSYFAFCGYFANVFSDTRHKIRNTHHTLFVFHSNFEFHSRNPLTLRANANPGVKCYEMWNVKNEAQNTKSKKYIAGYFVSLFSHFVPLFFPFRTRVGICTKRQRISLTKHGIWTKYMKVYSKCFVFCGVCRENTRETPAKCEIQKVYSRSKSSSTVDLKTTISSK